MAVGLLLCIGVNAQITRSIYVSLSFYDVRLNTTVIYE